MRSPRRCGGGGQARHHVCSHSLGYGQPADRERALASGFEEHFIKPLDVDALQRLMCEQAAKRP